jgi:uncharacterized RDD family membrane protein YckC
MIVHEVVTTEKVPIRYRVAGLGSRGLAVILDSLILLLLLVAAVLFGGVYAVIGGTGLAMAVRSLLFFALFWGYFLLFEWLWRGQTPGKRLLGLRVVGWRGTALTFSQAAVRNLVRVADLLPLAYGVGFAVAAGNRESRRLGDLAADTLVVHVEARGRPVQALHEAADGVERGRLQLLRQRLGQLDRAQKETLLDLCLRRDQLRVAERARLFHAAAQYLQGHLEIAPEEFESDEKFVVRLAAVLGG